MVANPGNQASTVGAPVTLSNSATGGAPPYTWSATGLPAGLTINGTTGQVTGLPTTAGASSVTITATGTDGLSGSAAFTWTVNPAAGSCAGTNSTDVAIPDNTTVLSNVVIAGCGGNASATTTVEVHIMHTARSDLIVSLIAPDGTAYVLHNRSGGNANDIHRTYTVNASSEAADGTWSLRVQDAASTDTGFIDTWSLTLR